MIRILSMLTLVSFVAGCSTVAGVGQDVQDVANWSRNKIVEKVNKKEVIQYELTEEELNAEPGDEIW
mgnify:CR=1 FL=1